MVNILKTILNYIQIIFGIYTMVIALVEEYHRGETGTGAAKKKEAIDKIKEWVNKAVEEKKIPSWVAWIASADFILDFVITIIVKALNDWGIFEHQGNESSTQSPS